VSEIYDAVVEIRDALQDIRAVLADMYEQQKEIDRSLALIGKELGHGLGLIADEVRQCD
jgi:hypothetical protein